jgi:rfaE bifunctional protein nucleotidyltransferase chain/domain
MEGLTTTPFEDGSSYTDIRRQFEDSPYGHSLHGEIRWDHFRPDSVTPDEWVEILGTDTDSLKHAPLMYGLTRQFIMHSPEGSLSSEDERILLLAAMTNGWGESGSDEEGITPMGNISYGQKTQNQQRQEQDTYRAVFQKLLGEHHLKEELMAESVLFNPDSRLGQVYDAVRHINYLRTALNAYAKAEALGDAEISSHLRWLSADVVSNQLPNLLQYAKMFPAAAEYVRSVAPNVDAILDEVPEDIFAVHGKSERVHADRFRLVRKLWKNGAEPDQTVRERRQNGNVESKFIKDYDRLGEIVAAYRTLGKQIVLTSGSFDMIHIGHAKYLETARSYGDILVVGVDSDTKIKQRKGPDRPVVPEEERVSMLTHIRGVDYVALKQPAHEHWKLIKTVRPDTLIATQETYSDEEIEQLAEYCGQVVVLPPQATTSTSAKIRRLQIGWNRQVVEPIERILSSDMPEEELRRTLGAFVLEIRNT